MHCNRTGGINSHEYVAEDLPAGDDRHRAVGLVGDRRFEVVAEEVISGREQVLRLAVVERASAQRFGNAGIVILQKGVKHGALRVDPLVFLGQTA